MPYWLEDMSKCPEDKFRLKRTSSYRDFKSKKQINRVYKYECPICRREFYNYIDPDAALTSNVSPYYLSKKEAAIIKKKKDAALERSIKEHEIELERKKQQAKKEAEERKRRKEEEEKEWQRREEEEEKERRRIEKERERERVRSLISGITSCLLSDDGIAISSLVSYEKKLKLYGTDDEYIDVVRPELKNDRDKALPLLNIMKENGFEYFHHHTDLENFIEIMRGGKLFSRRKVISEGEFKDGAENSIVDKTPEFVKNCVRFYYKEKTPTFYRNEGVFKVDRTSEQGNVPVPVAMLFSESLLFHSGVAFTDGNAGSDHSMITAKPETACGFDWVTTMTRGPHDPNSEITRRRNAEFLYPDEVDLKYLVKVAFRTPADKKTAEALLGEDERFVVDGRMFNDVRDGSLDMERNALYDYFMFLSSTNTMTIRFSFIKPPKGYRHQLDLTYKDGCEEILKFDLDDRNSDFDVEFDNEIQEVVYRMNGNMCAVWRREE